MSDNAKNEDIKKKGRLGNKKRKKQSKNEVKNLFRVFTTITRNHFRKKDEKYKNEVEMLKKYSSEEIGELRRKNRMKSLFFYSKIYIIVVILLLTSLAIHEFLSLSEYFSNVISSTYFENEREYLLEHKTWIALHSPVLIFAFLGAAFAFPILLLWIYTLLMQRLTSPIDKCYVDKKILFSEKLRKQYIFLDRMASSDLRHKSNLFFLGVVAVLVCAALFEQMEHILEFVLIVFLIYLSYISYSITVSTKKSIFGPVPLKRFQKARLIHLLITVFDIIFFVYVFGFLMVFSTLLAFRSWAEHMFGYLLSVFKQANFSLTDHYPILMYYRELSDSKTFLDLQSEILLFLKDEAPLMFILLIIFFIFLYFIPTLSINKYARRKSIVIIVSFFSGVIITRFLNRAIPSIFFLDMGSLTFIGIVMFLGYLSSELIESQVGGLIQEKECNQCKENNPLEARYCMFCGRKF